MSSESWSLRLETSFGALYSSNKHSWPPAIIWAEYTVGPSPPCSTATMSTTMTFLFSRWKACHWWFGQRCPSLVPHWPKYTHLQCAVTGSGPLLSVGLVPHYSQQQRDDRPHHRERRGGKATHGSMQIQQKRTAVVSFGSKQSRSPCTSASDAWPFKAGCLVIYQGSTSTSLNAPLPATHIDPAGP